MAYKIIPYNPRLKERACELRKDSTQTEVLLWRYIRKKQILGYDFDRQKPIDEFIVDFYCKELKLAVEIDGESHYGNEAKDKRRDRRLNRLGVTVIHIEDDLARYDTQKALDKIAGKIKELLSG